MSKLEELMKERSIIATKKTRKSHLDLILEVLESCIEPITRCRISCILNMNSSQINRYLMILTERDYIICINGKYKLTEKGFRLMEILK